ncbi:MAG: hypothetical protein KGJ78_08020 [Alphaproteobacteria bacterium]|nr:hypothetical protein [Alphaproteobacteria bacterium]
MGRDRKIIEFISPSDMSAVMAETGLIGVEGTDSAEGAPVIHAVFKGLVPATGAYVASGIPFTVVMSKGPKDRGYSNIAVVAKVPAGELNARSAAVFAQACNRELRFVRAYLSGQGDLVLQADLFLRMATREYVKFWFGALAEIYLEALSGLVRAPQVQDVDEPHYPPASSHADAQTVPAQEIRAAPEPMAGDTPEMVMEEARPFEGEAPAPEMSVEDAAVQVAEASEEPAVPAEAEAGAEPGVRRDHETVG